MQTQKITIALTAEQVAAMQPLYDELIVNPEERATLAQVIWTRDNVCELNFVLLYKPFACIVRDIMQLPGSRVPFAESQP